MRDTSRIPFPDMRMKRLPLVLLSKVQAFSYQGEKHIAPAGSIVVINPGEVHTGSAANLHVGWTYRMLYPDVKLLQQATSEARQKNIRSLLSDRRDSR